MATTTRSLDKETLLDWYRQIVLIRHFEDRCQDLYEHKKITGVYLHLYSGHEAVGVGSLAAIGKDDHVITGYRDHGLALARGVPANPIMAEMMGKRTGVSGGKGGSMHLASRAHNFWGGYAIVAGHLPLAAGIALKERYTGTENVILCFMGDGSTNNGYFHEALNLSAVWNLPVVWIIENNFVGMGTRIEDSSGQPELVKRAIAYGMKEGGRIDGQDVVAVYDAMTEAVAYARKKGPVLIEMLTYRYRGHGVSDKQYDAREDLKRELDDWTARKDPINILADRLRSEYKVSDADLQRINDMTIAVVEESVKFADESPAPTYEDLIANIVVD